MTITTAKITASNAFYLGLRLTRMGYTHLSQIHFVRQPMRVGGLWECEVAA